MQAIIGTTIQRRANLVTLACTQGHLARTVAMFVKNSDITLTLKELKELPCPRGRLLVESVAQATTVLILSPVFLAPQEPLRLKPLPPHQIHVQFVKRVNMLQRALQIVVSVIRQGITLTLTRALSRCPGQQLVASVAAATTARVQLRVKPALRTHTLLTLSLLSRILA